VKGLYKRALAGEIPLFTGISDPYEAPAAAEIVIDSASESAQDGVDRILCRLLELGVVSREQVLATSN